MFGLLWCSERLSYGTNPFLDLFWWFSRNSYKLWDGGCSSDIPSSYFSDQVKFGACSITGQWGGAQNKIKNAVIYISGTFFVSFCYFSKSFFIMMYALSTVYFSMSRKFRLGCMGNTVCGWQIFVSTKDVDSIEFILNENLKNVSA